MNAPHMVQPCRSLDINLLCHSTFNCLQCKDANADKHPDQYLISNYSVSLNTIVPFDNVYMSNFSPMTAKRDYFLFLQGQVRRFMFLTHRSANRRRQTSTFPKPLSEQDGVSRHSWQESTNLLVTLNRGHHNSFFDGLTEFSSLFLQSTNCDYYET